MSIADAAIAALGVNGLATTGALVYTVRRVAPWPKPPAPAQGSRGSRGSGGQPEAVNGPVPPGGIL